jgi:septum formation protein
LLRPLILASGSPRRKVLLATCAEDFQVLSPDLPNETLKDGLLLSQALEDLALRKAQSIAQTHEEAVVLGADTVVVRDGAVLGKPKDEAEALRMLESLNGRTHQVMTAWAVVCYRTQFVRTGHCVSTVHFKKTEESALRAYIATGEPMDKAGAYAIQGQGAFLVEKYEGSFDNIVGLPVEEICPVLGRAREDA